MSPPAVPDTRRNRSRSAFSIWLIYCPLGRHFDLIDSNYEDDMDAALAYALWAGGS